MVRPQRAASASSFLLFTSRFHGNRSVSASPSTDLLLGSSAQLQCQVKGPTEEPALEWRKPGGSVHKGSKVELESVARSDAGAWNCSFSHEGKPYSQSLHISVKGGSLTFAQHLLQKSSALPIQTSPCAFRTGAGPSDPAGGQRGADLQRLWVLLSFVQRTLTEPPAAWMCY